MLVYFQITFISLTIKHPIKRRNLKDRASLYLKAMAVPPFSSQNLTGPISKSRYLVLDDLQ